MFEKLLTFEITIYEYLMKKNVKFLLKVEIFFTFTVQRQKKGGMLKLKKFGISQICFIFFKTHLQMKKIVTLL